MIEFEPAEAHPSTGQNSPGGILRPALKPEILKMAPACYFENLRARISGKGPRFSEYFEKIPPCLGPGPGPGPGTRADLMTQKEAYMENHLT